ncbi:MAG: molybdopterin biosynthesis protein, partial [Firmicutes bacterium]|nr:molybdopterin biosynthesis protein [Bacillota bacterium]
FLARAIEKCDTLGQENVFVEDALGRITATSLLAKNSVPHYHAAAMDGIAVKAADTFTASETEPVILKINKNAYFVDTGSPLPEGCDAVIMIEDVFPLSSEDYEIRAAATPWQHVRSIGEDIVASEMILPPFHRIRPVDLGPLVAGGWEYIPVLKKPRVGILPTGSELVPLGSRPEKGQIIESNSYTFAGLLRSWGGEPRRYNIVKDEFDLIKKEVEQAVKENDLVLIGAGSSAGRKDHTVHVLQEMGEVLVHGVAIRPGKPAILAIVQGKPVVGVPGYPVSAYFILDLFVKPLLYRWQKQALPERDKCRAIFTRRVVSSLKEEEFLRVKLGKVGKKIIATPLSRGAGVSMSLVRADGLARIPLNCEGLEAGQEAEVELWRDMAEIENTVVCIGSHDVSLDLLGSFFKRKYPSYNLASTHVGSMGGIMALKRGECHLAGIHLLDEKTGEYNISFLKRYLPGIEIVLVNLLYRQLGLFVAPGNPKKIYGIEDLTRDEILFVNRQRGAGTRLFLDYQLKEKKLDPCSIKGYQREEYNHLAVAAAVASGSCDAGLGIKAAAVALGVDFVPLAQERYDLAIPLIYYKTEQVQGLLETISEHRFRKAVEELGGYDLSHSGEVIWQSSKI